MAPKADRPAALRLQRVAVIIPTYNAAPHFDDLSEALAAQDGLDRQQVLVIDSSSCDGTPERFRRWGARVHMIRQEEFDHGGTRRLAAELAADAEFLIFLTQDALPVGEHSLRCLLSAFENPAVGMAYGCQLPRQRANGIERHARLMNYPPDVAEERSLHDRDKAGIKTVFCSDSFAAYRHAALHAIGSFPASAYFAEDQIVAGRMLLAGWKLAYRGTAKVIHSHDYTIAQDFKRYFDVGVFHARNPWLLREFGRAEGEGLRFVKSEMRHLWSTDRMRIPAALARSLFKYGGYRLGRLEHHFSSGVKQRLSMSAYYWARSN
jgi:rhamnosyltransferase